MSYSQGGLIAAGDYNGFVGTSPSSTANQINTIWAVGSGYVGYGQSPISQVSSTGLVTATQWATAVNTLNSIKTHQTGSGTGIGAPTAGTLISYLSTFSSAINTAYSSAASFNSQGTTVTGSTISPGETYSNLQAAATFAIIRTVSFATGDAARYFFNAGGQINFVISSVVNNDATSRSGDMVTLLGTNLAGLTAFRANTNGGRTGSGGTSNTNNTGVGYYGLTTSNVVIQQVTSTTSGYTSDYVNFSVKTNGLQGSNNDNGNALTFNLNMYSAARPTLPAPPANPPGTGTTTTNTVVNDTINVTVNHRIDVIYPETTNLSNVWGAVTIS
jgi:hypothetical protein